MYNHDDVYHMNTMSTSNSESGRAVEQLQNLLQEDDHDPIQHSRKRHYKNSNELLLILGSLGTLIALSFLGLLLYYFASVSNARTTHLKLPSFGDIGCEFPGEIVTPVLEQNLTLDDGSLEVIITGRSIGDMIFHTETDDLDYVRLDVKLQGAQRQDLQSVYTRVRAGRYELQSPETPQKCMRYTLDIWLPPVLKSLHIRTDTLTHLSFDNIDQAARIEELNIKIRGDDEKNLLLLPECIVSTARYELQHGIIAGTTLLYDEVVIIAGQAQSEIEVVLMADPLAVELERHRFSLETSTKGMQKLMLKNPNNYRVDSMFYCSEALNLFLAYPQSFSGTIDMSAKRLSSIKAGTKLDRMGVSIRGAKDDVQSSLIVRADEGSVSISFDQ